MVRKPVFVNLTYKKIGGGLPIYVDKVLRRLSYESVSLEVEAGTPRGGFIKWYTSSRKVKRNLSKREDWKDILTVSLDSRYLYSDAMVVQHMPSKGTNPIEKFLLNKGMGNSQYLIAISETIANEVKEKYPNKEVYVVRNGIEPHPLIEHQKNSGIVVSQVGGLSQKRAKRLPMLQIPKVLREAFVQEKITFIHIGGKDTDNERKLKQECLDHGIEPDFKSNVPSEEIWESYARSDLYIYMSSEEGYSLTPMEALMMGTPCLISDIPVHKEVYSDKIGVRFAKNWEVTPENIREAFGLGVNVKYREQTLLRTWDDSIDDLDSVLKRITTNP